MGPLEWVLSMFSPLTDALNLDTTWLAAMAGNIIAIVSFFKRWLAQKKWAVWTIAGGFGLMYSGIQYWGNWPALAGATVVLIFATAGMLYVTSNGGAQANKMVPLGAGSRRKG